MATKAEQLIDQAIGRSELYEQSKLAQVAWKKLPTSLKKRVSPKQLTAFLDMLSDDASFEAASLESKIPYALATDVLAELEKAGLL